MRKFLFLILENKFYFLFQKTKIQNLIGAHTCMFKYLWWPEVGQLLKGGVLMEPEEGLKETETHVVYDVSIQLFSPIFVSI